MCPIVLASRMCSNVLNSRMCSQTCSKLKMCAESTNVLDLATLIRSDAIHSFCCRCVVSITQSLVKSSLACFATKSVQCSQIGASPAAAQKEECPAPSATNSPQTKSRAAVTGGSRQGIFCAGTFCTFRHKRLGFVLPGTDGNRAL